MHNTDKLLVITRFDRVYGLACLDLWGINFATLMNRAV
jgi:hypothetical protein